MEQANWFILPISALIPLVIGFIYYHPKVFGTRMKKITGADTFGGKPTIGKIALIYLFSLLFSYVLSLNSIHQIAIFQLFFMDPSIADASSEFSTFTADFISKYGERHRSLGHGLLHGAEASLCYGLAALGINAILNGKPLSQIWVNLGFCVLCGSLMAGLNCAFF